MATRTFIDITPTALAAQVNAYLASFAGLSYYINQPSIIQNSMERRGQSQLQCIINIVTAGSPPALATPFTLQFVQAKDATAFDLATAAVLALPGSAYSTSWRNISDVRVPATLPFVLGWALTNATVGAGANYTNL